MFMLFYKNILTLSILAAVSVTAFAAENEKVESLETIRIKAHPLEQTSQVFAVADSVIDQAKATTDLVKAFKGTITPDTSSQDSGKNKSS